MKMVLSIDTNAKTVKGQKYGFSTGILFLAPADLSGYNVCPFAEAAGCKQVCLNTAGRGVFNSVQSARLAKTIRFHEDRLSFMNDIAFSIYKVIRHAINTGTTPVIRLNGTSDIRWEYVSFELTAETARRIGRVAGMYKNIMQLFTDVQFYDYTKIPGRQNLPENYDITFSYSGTASYQRIVKLAIANGERMAVVFRSRDDIPAEFMGMKVVDGDDSDLRHLDPQGTVVALYAKGKAKTDTSGFVVDIAKERSIQFA
jgi:hypothetical protein